MHEDSAKGRRGTGVKRGAGRRCGDLKVVNLGLLTYVAARDTALCIGLSASRRVATAGEGTVTYVQIARCDRVAQIEQLIGQGHSVSVRHPTHTKLLQIHIEEALAVRTVCFTKLTDTLYCWGHKLIHFHFI